MGISYRKKNQKRLFIFTILIAVLVISFWFAKRYDFFNDSETTFTRYPAFGIEIPTDYRIHGIDVSRYQRRINWTMVKQMRVDSIRIGFCFMKATEGIGMVDEQYRRNWKKSKEVNMVRGAYHYFIPYKSGKAQAENFIETVDLEPGDLPPVLDLETLSGSNVKEMQQNAKEWLTTIEDYYKVKPIIYTGVDFYKRNLNGAFDSYPLWAAHYQHHRQPDIIRNWTLWQHNESGHVNGIEGTVDFNAFNGDSASFRLLLVK